MIEQKKEMQIRNAILRFEKSFGELWNVKEGTITEGRLFTITFGYYLSSFSASHFARYTVKDKKTGKSYKAIHYLGNQHFSRSTGWAITREPDVEVKKE